MMRCRDRKGLCRAACLFRCILLRQRRYIKKTSNRPKELTSTESRFGEDFCRNLGESSIKKSDFVSVTPAILRSHSRTVFPSKYDGDRRCVIGFQRESNSCFVESLTLERRSRSTLGLLRSCGVRARLA